ncbi:MAG TPA: gamma-glutamylcyclotransferase family protein [Burkholderiales bacterium]|nr:gamma-glutamylcyclotransferase family protein [Burkholderiales bacterium]
MRRGKTRTLERSMRTRVFVYGTLKEGFPNTGANAGARIPGAFVTKSRYPLYLVGQRHSPWMVNTPGEGSQVVGQVFEMEPEALERIDILQRVSVPDGYERIQITVGSLPAERENDLLVHAYLKHPRNLAGAEIMAGPLSEYTIEHAALYRKREP